MAAYINNLNEHFVVRRDGKKYTLDCRVHDQTIECTARKLALYAKDIPTALCPDCDGGRLKEYTKLVKAAKREKRDVISTRKDYYDNQVFTLASENEAVAEIVEVDEDESIVVKKKVKKTLDCVSLSDEGTGEVIIKCPSSTVCSLLEGFALVFSTYSKRHIIVYKSDYGRTRLDSIFNELGVRYRFDDEGAYHIYGVPLVDLSSIEKYDDSLEEDEVQKVLENPQEPWQDVDVESDYNTLLKAVDERDNLVQDYYYELKHYAPVFECEEDERHYLSLKEASEEKHQESADVLYGDWDKVVGDRADDEASEDRDHLIDPSVALHCPRLFPDVVKSFVYAPQRRTKIDPRIRGRTAIVLDLSPTEMKELGGCINDIDQKLYIKALRELRAIKICVKAYYTLPEYNINKYLPKHIKALDKLKEQYPEEMKALISECFTRVDSASVVVDPVAVVSFIIALGDETYNYMASYMMNTRRFVHTGSRSFFIKGNKYAYLNNSTIQKLLYIDSGVAALYHKLALRMALPSPPVEMWNPRIGYILGPEVQHVPEIALYVEETFFIDDFLSEVCYTGVSGYSIRSRIATVLSSIKYIRRFMVDVESYLCDQMCRGNFLNEEEIDALSEYAESTVHEIVASDVANAVSQKPLTRLINIGTILKLKKKLAQLEYKRDEEDDDDDDDE